MTSHQNLLSTVVDKFGTATVLELSVHKSKIILALKLHLRGKFLCSSVKSLLRLTAGKFLRTLDDEIYNVNFYKGI